MAGHEKIKGLKSRKKESRSRPRCNLTLGSKTLKQNNTHLITHNFIRAVDVVDFPWRLALWRIYKQTNRQTWTGKKERKKKRKTYFSRVDLEVSERTHTQPAWVLGGTWRVFTHTYEGVCMHAHTQPAWLLGRRVFWAQAGLRYWVIVKWSQLTRCEFPTRKRDVTKYVRFGVRSFIKKFISNGQNKWLLQKLHRETMG